MIPQTDNSAILVEEQIPIDNSIRMKEMFFMLLICAMGFSGIQLCVKKFYPDTPSAIDDIVVHETDFAQVEI